MVRAKFTCVGKNISLSNGKPLSTYVFYPVTSGSDENKEFFQYTPSGKIELGTINEKVSFEIGKEYYLDFSPAEKAA